MQQGKPFWRGVQASTLRRPAPRATVPFALVCVVAGAAPACDRRAPTASEQLAPSNLSKTRQQHTLDGVVTSDRAAFTAAAGEADNAPPNAASSGDTAGEQIAPSLRKVLNRLRREQAQDFYQPSAENAVTYRSALSSALSEAATPWPSVPGFTWIASATPGVRILAEEAHNSGAGAFVLRSRPRSPVVIQAPHTFFDSGTLPLAVHLFDALNASVLMVNTQHRAHGVKDSERAARARAGKEVTDVAHNALTYYQAAHEACLAALPDAVTVQIHGYRNGKERRAVISAAGTNGPAKEVAREINEALGEPIAQVFPDQVQVLGGMSNVQARASRAENRRFVHLELSTALRKALLEDQALLDKFTQGLISGLGHPAAKGYNL